MASILPIDSFNMNGRPFSDHANAGFIKPYTWPGDIVPNNSEWDALREDIRGLQRLMSDIRQELREDIQAQSAFANTSLEAIRAINRDQDIRIARLEARSALLGALAGAAISVLAKALGL